MPDTEMEYAKLGDTGLEVSRFCLGCMNFGSDREWMIGDEERSLDHLEENVGALDVSLSEAEMERLEAPIEPAWSRAITDLSDYRVPSSL